MTSVPKDKTIWACFPQRLLRLRGLLWPDILHSIPGKHLSIARCAGGAYGIINQYHLKMTGLIGGMISDKILKSPSKYLCYTFITSHRCARTVDYAAARKYAGIFRDGMYAGLWRDSLYTASRIFCTYRRSKIVENKNRRGDGVG